jgi:ubiquinone biosynthesis protein
VLGSFRRVRKLILVCHKYHLFKLIKRRPTLQVLLFMSAFILAPFNRRVDESIPVGERICSALTDLGPIYVKFGQLLSTRRDLLPLDIAMALSKLQDDVEPFAGTEAKEIVERALEVPIDEHFTQFEVTPMASASIAQVHAATLKSGDDVVIKVLRPNIAEIIDKDLKLLSTIANLLHRYIRQSERFKPREVVADYQATILSELDLQNEAYNAEKLRKLWQGSELLYVPRIYKEFTHAQVMVIERIYGVPIMDLETLHEAGTNMEVLSERGVEIFFTQVFRDSFFHADMHPGNIFVDISDPNKPRYMAIDFGIMGSLQAHDQRYLAENFIAFFNRDYHQVAQLHVDSGWVPAGTPVDEFERAIESVCEPIFGKPLEEISFGHLLISLFQTAQKFNMPVQPQLVLLQKTLLYIEGLGRQLYPQLDLWKTAKPYLENWLKERMSVKTLLKEILQKAPIWREKLPELPDLIYGNLKQAQHNQSLLEQQNKLLQQQMLVTEKQNRSLLYYIVGASLIITTAILFSADNQWGTTETVTIISALIALAVGRVTGRK